MGFSFIHSSAHVGIQAYKVTIEADISPGLPRFNIVGLPDAAVNEARERVRSALKNSGFSFPRTRLTINLAPTAIKKQGPNFDLALALSILRAQGILDHSELLSNSIILGELSLFGDIKPVNAVLLSAMMAKEQGIQSLIIPKKNADEAALISGITIYAPKNLSELVCGLQENKLKPFFPKKKAKSKCSVGTDMKYIRGQHFAKRALEIAAAGGHNILLSGPPGSGKTMLARAIPSILPTMSQNEAIEVTMIQSLFSSTHAIHTLAQERPFRAPHHTSSNAALIGGGTWPRPGEVSLAHRGILFLDEFPEFSRAAIENLRQPLEDRTVTISRAAGTLQFPAHFMLVAAMNPCPCGNATEPSKVCICTHRQVERYQQKLSGPMMDRIDLLVHVPRVDLKKLTSKELAESSENIRKRIQTARNIQTKRFTDASVICNAEIPQKFIYDLCNISIEAEELIKTAARKWEFSARTYMRLLKVSRTIADLEKSEKIKEPHIAEALQYRSLPQTI